MNVKALVWDTDDLMQVIIDYASIKGVEIVYHKNFDDINRRLVDLLRMLAKVGHLLVGHLVGCPLQEELEEHPVALLRSCTCHGFLVSR